MKTTGNATAIGKNAGPGEELNQWWWRFRFQTFFKCLLSQGMAFRKTQGHWWKLLYTNANSCLSSTFISKPIYLSLICLYFSFCILNKTTLQYYIVPIPPNFRMTNSRGNTKISGREELFPNGNAAYKQTILPQWTLQFDIFQPASFIRTADMWRTQTLRLTGPIKRLGHSKTTTTMYFLLRIIAYYLHDHFKSKKFYQ